MLSKNVKLDLFTTYITSHSSIGERNILFIFLEVK